MHASTDRALFGVILYESVESLDVGATHGVLSMARRLVPNLEMTVVAENAGPVSLANGLQVVAHHGFSDCPRLDVAIVCGGSGSTREAQNPAMLELLRKVAKEGGIVASVCSACLILAAAGLLDGRAATTRRFTIGAEAWSPLERLAEAYPRVRCTPAAVVDAGNVVTGGGVTLAIDTTLHLIGRLYGLSVAHDVAAMLEYAHALGANRRAIGVVEAPASSG